MKFTNFLPKHLARGVVAAAVAFSPMANMAQAADDITVAYFLEWPTPNQVAQLEKTYDRELGVNVTWKSFDNGNAMSAAMASGDVQIAYSQGFVPFVVGVTRGLNLKTVGIAVSYADADNCVVHNNAGLDRTNVNTLQASLKGMKIATPVGNNTHYKLLRVLGYFGVTADDVTIVPVSGGNDAAAAFLSGQVDIGCAFGGPIQKMLEQGTVLMTGAEQENSGILTFDVITADGDWAAENPDMMVKFMQVTEDANRAFAANPLAKWDTLKKASALDDAAMSAYLGSNGSFTFPSKAVQLSATYMDGTVQNTAKDIADFYVGQGDLDKALDSYAHAIDSSYLAKVK